MIGRRMESFDLKESLLSCSIQVKRVSCGQCVHRSCVAIGASERAFLVVVVVVRVLSFTLQLPPSCIHVYDIDRGPEHQKMGTNCRNYEEEVVRLFPPHSSTSYRYSTRSTATSPLYSPFGATTANRNRHAMQYSIIIYILVPVLSITEENTCRGMWDVMIKYIRQKDIYKRFEIICDSSNFVYQQRRLFVGRES